MTEAVNVITTAAGYPSDGSQCECCGLGLDVQAAPCGHYFCYVCRGREHDEDCDGLDGHARVIGRGQG